MASTSRAVFLQESRTTLAGVEQNETELEHVLVERDQLLAEVASIEASTARQNHHLWQYQQATRDVEDSLHRGRDLLTRIKNAVRALYGLRSEKLQEFGMRVRRFTRLPAKPTPPEEGLTPPPAATPETDGTIQK